MTCVRPRQGAGREGGQGWLRLLRSGWQGPKAASGQLPSSRRVSGTDFNTLLAKPWLWLQLMASSKES